MTPSRLSNGCAAMTPSLDGPLNSGSLDQAGAWRPAGTGFASRRFRRYGAGEYDIRPEGAK
jgi:hypothetical protein